MGMTKVDVMGALNSVDLGPNEMSLSKRSQVGRSVELSVALSLLRSEANCFRRANDRNECSRASICLENESRKEGRVYHLCTIDRCNGDRVVVVHEG